MSMALPATTTAPLPAMAHYAPSAHLQEVLRFANGSSVTRPAQWPARRAELKQLVETHILGTLPNETPSLTAATLLNSSSIKSSPLCSSYVRLDFLANRTNVTFDIELAWMCGLKKSLPIFLSQFNHRGWGLAGSQRGYLMVLYPGGDTRDASGDFRAAYPQFTFRKILGRAFVASRAIDFLLSDRYAKLGLPGVDKGRISISGHSRNGKQSLVAAAFDERIVSVVGSSPGTPISAPIRYSSPDFNGEPTLYDTTQRDWFLESLYGFYGKEHEVPADGHMVLAMIAPRHVMIATADSDESGDVTFAVERGVVAALPAFSLVGAAEGSLKIRYRPGRHHGFLDVQSYFDFFDHAAGLSPDVATIGGAHFFPPHPLHIFNWSAWHQATPPAPPPPSPAAPLKERVEWLLGDGIKESWTAGLHAATHYCESGDEGTAFNYAAALMERDHLADCKGPACTHKVVRRSLSFGPYITADLYVPSSAAGGGGDDGADDGVAASAAATTPLPVVIFLPGHSYHMGVTGAYNHLKSSSEGGLIKAIAARGVAVLSWDLTGMGMRQHIDGAPLFYARHPHASRLGAIVGEVYAALDAIQCASANPAPECEDGEGHTGTYPKLQLPLLDPSRVYLVGYSLGATAALHAAALTPPGKPIRGVATFGGWTPWRTGGGGEATGGLRMLYETLALLPRLGLFEGDPKQIPYDYDELIASLAPRELLLYAPRGNRFAVADEVAAVVRAANDTWRKAGSAASFEAHMPADGVSQMRDAEIAVALDWVERVVLKK